MLGVWLCGGPLLFLMFQKVKIIDWLACQNSLFCYCYDF
ncbi:hypothetical protein B4109_1718 [Geobacillus stearothermophilus]|uniref:Uncharacterized protein n=1 Tax=Geobacillus stearothermophilus TaxID=1422 RepID=A0A150MX84_GEOSE|nr:hypothetical protein B4109_1718 [Geobacillus stearothermophilus]